MRSHRAAKPASAHTLNRLLQNADLQDSENATPHRVSERRRQRSVDAWHCLRGAVVRQHAAVAKNDPNNPRIRVSLAPVSRGAR
jgi:hypothetical protein